MEGHMVNLGDSIVDLLNRKEIDPFVMEFLGSMQGQGLLLDKRKFMKPNSSLSFYKFTKIGLQFGCKR